MRVVSLLPSLSELVCSLGRGAELVGVSHECDFPRELSGLPKLTRSLLEPSATSLEIDRAVEARAGSLYELDERALAELKPDLILTQAQCDVCAVSEVGVREAAARLPGSPLVESVNPMDLEGVFAMFRRVGDLLGARTRAEELVGRFEEMEGELAKRWGRMQAPRVVIVEWADPIYSSGHWNPDLVAAAGGREVIGRAGRPARRCEWDDVVSASPDVIILAPCGFDLARSLEELATLSRLPGWDDLPAVRSGRVVVADGSSYFARPGPRLVESLAIVGAAIDPERAGDLAPREGWTRAGAVA